MFWFRSFALGLLGACCLLLAMRPPIAVVASEPGKILVVSSPSMLSCPSPAPPRVEPPVTVVDVAAGVSAEQLATLVVLAPGERIVAIDDVAVAPGITSRAALAALAPKAGRYIDLTVDTYGPQSRRVLVLLR